MYTFWYYGNFVTENNTSFYAKFLKQVFDNLWQIGRVGTTYVEGLLIVGVGIMHPSSVGACVVPLLVEEKLAWAASFYFQKERSGNVVVEENNEEAADIEE